MQGKHLASFTGEGAAKPRANAPLRSARARPFKPLVAVLYSGRFYGLLSRSWADNHLQFLIQPLDAEVFITVDPDNWCHAPAEARVALHAKRMEYLNQIFQREVQMMFSNYSKIHARVVRGIGDNTTFVHSPAMKTMFNNAVLQVGIRNSFFWYSLLRRWYMQFLHYADAEQLRLDYGHEHDVVIRMRLDVGFTEICKLPTIGLDSKTVFALGYFAKVSYPGPPQLDSMSSECDDRGEQVTGHWAVDLRRRNISESSHAHIPCQRLWRDYIFLGAPISMKPLAEMALATYNRTRMARPSFLVDRGTRCLGLCAEEQTVLHFREKGISLAPLGWRWQLNRIPKGGQRTPLLSTSQVCTTGAGSKIHR